MDTDRAPRPTGNVFDVNLSGLLFPWRDGPPPGPVLLRVTGDRFESLPLFADAEALRALMTRAGIVFDRIRQVTDGDAFLGELRENAPADLRVIVNPRYTDEGKIRYALVNPFARFRPFGEHER